MAAPDEIIPIEVNLDASPFYLGNRKGRLIRNFDFAQYAGATEGENSLVIKPLQSTFLYDPTFQVPAGKCFTVGEYVPRGTSEGYAFVWNENPDKHFIYRMRQGKCEMVFIGPLKFDLDPRHFIGE